MRVKRFVARALAVLLTGLIAAPLYAQLPSHLRDYPLAPLKERGDLIAPFFDGWIPNEDGSVTMIFGFLNRNTKEIVDIPLGPNNFIEPKQFDGAQPTHFPIYDLPGFVGKRDRGAFAVTVPAEMAGTEVVWTLKHAGHNYSIPGRATSPAYEMSLKEASLGSLGPAIRFARNGPESVDRVGIYAAKVKAKVGVPVTLSAFVQDRGNRSKYEEIKNPFYPVGTNWILHQGPAGARPTFDPQAISGKERATQAEASEGGADFSGWITATTQAMFPVPGNYVVRIRVDNFAAEDSQLDNQCCWSNAYVPVTVSP